MKQEHHPRHPQTYNKGANTDDEIEFQGSDTSGEYRTSRNARTVDINGNIGALVKIKGHELFHDLTNAGPNSLSSNYECLIEFDINGKKVCCWAAPGLLEPPAISIDGQIVAKSPDLTFSVDHPPQGDKNENCLGGEFFYTDHNSQPLIFNMQDMLDNISTQK